MRDRNWVKAHPKNSRILLDSGGDLYVFWDRKLKRKGAGHFGKTNGSNWIDREIISAV